MPPEVRKRCKRYTGATGPQNVADKMIRFVLASDADTAVIPMQDLLSLDTDARMNMPGRLGGNWTWRLKKLPGREFRLQFRDTLAACGRL